MCNAAKEIVVEHSDCKILGKPTVSRKLQGEKEVFYRVIAASSAFWVIPFLFLERAIQNKAITHSQTHLREISYASWH